jgi:hypothetical protein
MSNFMHKVKDAMTDHDNKDTARGFMTSHDGQGSTNAPATESGLNQNRSSGVGSNNPYGSDIRPSDGPAAYREPKFQGESTKLRL